MRQERRETFTVSAVNGEYAPEVLYCNPESDPRAAMDLVAEFSALVEALPATAVIEVDLLRAGGVAELDTDWVTAVFSYNAAGMQSLVPLAAWRGVRFRAKSGGTAGTAAVSATWW